MHECTNHKMTNCGMYSRRKISTEVTASLRHCVTARSPQFTHTQLTPSSHTHPLTHCYAAGTTRTCSAAQAGQGHTVHKKEGSPLGKMDPRSTRTKASGSALHSERHKVVERPLGLRGLCLLLRFLAALRIPNSEFQLANSEILKSKIPKNPKIPLAFSGRGSTEQQRNDSNSFLHSFIPSFLHSCLVCRRSVSGRSQLAERLTTRWVVGGFEKGAMYVMAAVSKRSSLLSLGLAFH